MFCHLRLLIFDKENAACLGSRTLVVIYRHVKYVALKNFSKEQTKEENMKKETRHDNAFDYPELDKISAQEFYDIYKNFMLSIAKAEGLDHGQADMVINDVLVIIYVKRRCHFDPTVSRFSNYLATIVRNACRSLKRREHRYVNCEEGDLARLSDNNRVVSIDNAEELADIRKMLEEGIRILRTEVRSQLMVDSFSMMLLKGERPKDIARMLNVRPDYVSLAMNHCKPRLRAILKRIMA